VRSLDRLLLEGGGELRFHEYDDDDKLYRGGLIYLTEWPLPHDPGAAILQINAPNQGLPVAFQK
jgi:hypothetical protein